MGELALASLLGLNGDHLYPNSILWVKRSQEGEYPKPVIFRASLLALAFHFRFDSPMMPVHTTLCLHSSKGPSWLRCCRLLCPEVRCLDPFAGVVFEAESLTTFDPLGETTPVIGGLDDGTTLGAGGTTITVFVCAKQSGPKMRLGLRQYSRRKNPLKRL